MDRAPYAYAFATLSGKSVRRRTHLFIGEECPHQPGVRSPPQFRCYLLLFYEHSPLPKSVFAITFTLRLHCLSCRQTQRVNECLLLPISSSLRPLVFHHVPGISIAPPAAFGQGHDADSPLPLASLAETAMIPNGSVRFPAGTAASPRRSRSTWTACGGCRPG